MNEKIIEIKYLGNKKLIPKPGVTYTIGREPGNEIILPDSTVSRKHASITFNGKDCLIRDLNSRNGVFVNDKKVLQARLKDHDLITIGGIPITIVAKPDVTATSGMVKNEFQSRSDDSILIHRKFDELLNHVEKGSPLAKELKDIHEAVSQSRKRLKAAATIDSLTGIYNRGYFDKLLKSEILRNARYEHPVSLLLIDIDKFKDVNDEYGHQQGDRILKWIADLLRKIVRQTDVVARYGGEEFTVILLETELNNATKVAEKIREKIAVTSQFELVKPITVSIGISNYPENGFIDKEIIRAADIALYHSKQHGRNQVSVSK
jgi:diguanylate cyclase (GGDEF)-like protein